MPRTFPSNRINKYSAIETFSRHLAVQTHEGTDSSKYKPDIMHIHDCFAPVPENLSDWKLKYPGVRGCVYFDNSNKGKSLNGYPTRHKAFRAEVIYNGKRYRKRPILYWDCVEFLLQLSKKFGSSSDECVQSALFPR